MHRQTYALMLHRLWSMIDYCSRVTILLLPDQLLIHRAYLCGGKFNGVEVHFMMSEFHFWHLCCLSEYIIHSKTQCSWYLLITRSFPAQRSIIPPVWFLCDTFGWKSFWTVKTYWISAIYIQLWLTWFVIRFIWRCLHFGPILSLSSRFFPHIIVKEVKTQFCHPLISQGMSPCINLRRARHNAGHSATEPRRVSPHLCMLIICRATLSGGGDVEGEKPVRLDIPTLRESPAVGPNIALKRQVRRCSHQPQ